MTTGQMKIKVDYIDTCLKHVFPYTEITSAIDWSHENIKFTLKTDDDIPHVFSYPYSKFCKTPVEELFTEIVTLYKEWLLRNYVNGEIISVATTYLSNKELKEAINDGEY